MSQFSESGKDFNPSALTPVQQRTLRASQKTPNLENDDLGQRILNVEIKAKFKIELMFGPKRTVTGPNVVVIQCWESGKRFHGGGDDLMYFCRDVESEEGCWAPITGDRIASGVAFCFNCGQVSARRLTGQRFMKVPTKILAEHVANIWRQLDQKADIYCKYDRDDIRYKVIEEKKGAAEAHRLRGLFIYPLKNILKDTAAGASVESRFEAFFKA